MKEVILQEREGKNVNVKANVSVPKELYQLAKVRVYKLWVLIIFTKRISNWFYALNPFSYRYCNPAFRALFYFKRNLCIAFYRLRK